jgi:Acetyltransferase (GNAT) domain
MSDAGAACSAELEIGPWRAGDEESIVRLFQRVFGRARTVADWRWQFLPPGGVPHVIVARAAQGEVVAHFGCVPRRALLDGAEILAANAVDSMVAPEHRVGLQRRGLFARVVDQYVATFGWPGPEHFGYGLPSPAALRLGRRLLGYETLRDALLLVRPDGPASWHARGLELEVSSSTPADHDELWAHIAAASALTVVRDRRYADWRYASCPAGGYLFVVARRGGAPAALAVFTPRSPSEDGAILADLLWPGDDDEALQACLDEAAALAQRAGRRHLALLAAPHAPEARRLAQWGWRPVPLGLPLVARCYAPGLQPEALRSRWAYAAGDFDLV